MMEDTRGLECFWGDDKHPHCAHGPTALFGKYVDGTLERFYVCSACRDRKFCRFYLKYGEKLTKTQQDALNKEKKQIAQSYYRQKLFVRFNELLAMVPENRSYCHDCERLIYVNEREKHKDHNMTIDITDYQMHHPTEILKPLENSKKEAQYFFSKKSVKDIAGMLLELRAKQVICIGAPRIHEYINENLDDKISSLLLDIDGRFHNFFGPLSYAWYNLFNHHFFNEEAESVFKDFLIQNKGKDSYLICDPPFGGRVELISRTIKKISDLHKKLNNIENSNDDLKIMFIFPYFMEGIIREKSNPPSILGGLKDLKMLDYKVDYENHPLFVTDSTGRKYGSPIRIFTNIPLSLLKLSESDGYKYCKRCRKWVSSENKHCKKCKDCTSKDGRRYRHCKLCERCVKPTWKHCKTCNRCLLETHKCNEKPKITGRCFKCNELGHTERDCSFNNNELQEKQKKLRKRKNSTNEDSSIIKTKKTSINSDSKTKTKLKINIKSKGTIAREEVKDVKVNIKKGLPKTHTQIRTKPNLITRHKLTSPRFKRLRRVTKRTKLYEPALSNETSNIKKKLVSKMKVEDINKI